MSEPMQPLEPEQDEQTEAEPVEPTTPEQDEQTEAEEADEGEAEGEPSEAQPPEGEPPPEAEPQQGMTQAQAEALFRRSEKAFDTYARAIGRIWGDGAANLIPVTISPSAPPGFINPDDAGRVPEDVQRPVLAFFGMPIEAELEPDRNRPACDKCKGRGKVATGSLVPEYRKLKCDVCNGKGYVEPHAATANGPGPSERVPVAVGAEGEGEPPPDVDDWGTPRLLDDGMHNPNWGRGPAYWDHDFPVGGVK